MKKDEKIKLLATLIELYVSLGCDITPLIGKHLSYFDFKKIKIKIEELKEW